MHGLLLFAEELLAITLDAGPFLLFGFAFAGLVYRLVTPERMLQLLGNGRISSIFRAALIGAPLPLCSCSVIPTALTLRRNGAGKGATASFLISTPETDVQSIVLTYGLMDGVMTICRPVAAVLLACFTGIMIEYLDPAEAQPSVPAPEDGGCGCGKECAPAPRHEHHSEHKHAHHHEHKHKHHHHAHSDHSTCGAPPPPEPWPHRLGQEVTEIFRYAFGPLLDDISWWLVIGLVASAAVAALIPPGFVEEFLGAGLLPKLVMVFVGVPLYICAASTTPLAAALLAKGMAPGTALVFLLAGPATNLGLISVLLKTFGSRFTAVYLGCIGVGAIMLGMVVDVLYTVLGVSPLTSLATPGEPSYSAMQWLSAVVLVLLLLRSMLRQPLPSEFRAPFRYLGDRCGLRLSPRQCGMLLLALGGAAWLSTAITEVPPGAVAVLRPQLGEARLVQGPGWVVHLPAPLLRAEIVEITRLRQVEVNLSTPERWPLTQDEALIALSAAAHYRLAAESIAWLEWEPEALRQHVGNLVEAALVETLAACTLEQVYGTERANVEHRAHLALSRMAEPAGVAVQRVLLLDVHAPEPVHDVFRDAAGASEDARRIAVLSTQEADAMLSEARTTARQVSAQATQQALLTAARGQGEACRYRSSAEGAALVGDAAWYETYLSTLERALSGSALTVRPADAAVEWWFGPASSASSSSAAPPKGEHPASALPTNVQRLLDR